MKRISNAQRQRIAQLLQENKSSRQIAKTTGVSPSTIQRVRRQLLADLPKSKGGRPKQICPTTARWMARQVPSGKADTAVELKSMLLSDRELNVCGNTVRKELKRQGLRAYVKKRKARLLARHKKKRMEFAQKYKGWTTEDWKQVIWSDETKINLYGSDGRKWVWHRPGASISERRVEESVKFGGASLMMWGCMTAQGVGYATKIDGALNAALYVDIVEDELQWTMGHFHLNRREITFEHDNDPKHTSHLARNWLSNNSIRVLDWPAQSPHLNPIEHLWSYLKRQLAPYENAPQDIDELWQRVVTDWYKIPLETCTDLIESMPRRVAAVLKARGGHTNY